MPTVIGLTDKNKTVSGSGDIDYPIDGLLVFGQAYSDTDEIQIYHNKPDGLITASLNGGEMLEAYSGVTDDLKPAVFPLLDATIDNSDILDQTYYKFDTPTAAHRYTFEASDSSDSGSGTTANGSDTSVVYNGEVATFNGTTSSTSVVLPSAATIESSCIVIQLNSTADSSLFTPSNNTASNVFNSLWIDAGELKIFNDNGGALKSTGFFPITGILYYICTIDTGSSIDVYVNGMKYASISSGYSPTTSTHIGWGSRYYTPGRYVDGDYYLVEAHTTSIAEEEALKRYYDMVKAKDTGQEFTVHPTIADRSRVIRVGVSGRDFNTDDGNSTQNAVDAAVQGNETIIVDAGTSAIHTPRDSIVVIDGSIDPIPTLSTWQGFAT